MSENKTEHNEPAGGIGRIVQVLINLRWILLGIGFALIAIYWPVASKLSFDQSIESLYAEENTHLQSYLRSRDLFGGDEFVILANRNPNLFANRDELELSEESIAEISALVKQLTGQTLEDEDDEESIEENSESELPPESTGVPGIQPDSVQNLASSLDFKHTRKRVTSLIEGVLIGEDRETNAVVMRLQAEHDAPVPRSETIETIKQIAAEQPRATYVVGEPVQIQDMFTYVEEDGQLLLCLARFTWADTSRLLQESALGDFTDHHVSVRN
ncbi:MAG: hypothetical protein R3C11_03055 [Planctomycetaceae bacterium]